MLSSLIKTTTFKQSQITILGTIINGALGLLFYALIAHVLTPANLGLFTVAIVTLTLVSDIVDFGTNTGLVRFVPSHLLTEQQKALRFLKLGLKIKLLAWIGILAIGFVLAPILAREVFNKPDLTIPLRLATIGVGGALLFSYTTAALQAFQKFTLWSLVNISTNLLRLILVALLFYYQQLNLFNSLLAYILFPFVGFLFALNFLPFKKIISVTNEKSVARELFGFNKWVVGFTIISAFSSKLDTFLTARLLSANDIGLYGAANQLTQVIPQIVGALGIVAAPKFASFKYKNEMLAYFKKFQIMVIILGALISLAIPLSFYLIPILYGPNYYGAIIPFIVLLLGMIIFLLSVPLHNSIIFYYSRSDIFVWIGLVNLFITCVLGFFMITNFGLLGSALTVLVGMISNFLLPLGWFILKIRK